MSKTQSTSDKIRESARIKTLKGEIMEVSPPREKESAYSHLEDLDEELINNPPLFIPEETKKLPGVYIPNWDNEPIARNPVVMINGISILRHQNLTSIIASPGSGKSSFCEAVCSSFLNPDCDSLGISIGKEIGCVLYFDCERTDEDLHNSFKRIYRRANITRDQEAPPVRIYGLRAISKHEQRIETIETLVSFENSENLLVIIDGAGDLVKNVNDLDESVNCRFWIRQLTQKGISVLTTLHPNKGTLNPRGHIGSELLREADGVLAIQKKNEIHLLTTNFEHGKNRNAGEVTCGFKWNDEVKMFTSIKLGSGKEQNLFKNMHPRELEHDQIIEMLGAVLGKLQLPYNRLLPKLKDWIKENKPEYKHGDNVIKELLSMLTEMHYITQTPTGKTTMYKLHPDTITSLMI